MNQATDQKPWQEETSWMTTGMMRAQPMFEESSMSEEEMERINQFAPGRLNPEQVYARSMFLCSSQLCLSDGCRFTRSALEEIAERVVGLSVLTGHDRTSLPLARFYKANIVQRGSDEQGEPIYFVRAWFYWLRDTTGARDLLLNIDGGIYREVSLAWRYDSWRCSICHASNGSCNHRTGVRYNGQICYRHIEHITEVLEGSLVYKSADRNTHLAGVRSVSPDSKEESFLLIVERDDPILPLLDRAGAVQERYDLQAVREPLTQSVDCLWIRGDSSAFIESAAVHLLTEEGICLGEIRSPRLESQTIGGELHYRTRRESSPEGVLSGSMREEHHGTVRTI